MKAIDPQKLTEKLIQYIKTSFRAASFKHAVIALSGGVDSSTSLSLTVRALEKENVYPVLLPYGNLNQQGTEDALLVIKLLKIPSENVVSIDIKPQVDPLLALDPSIDQIRRGNIMARVRMIVLFDQAKKHQALVVGTENKSEHLLGYFTRFGDEASDIEPLRNLYKTQVYQLAKYLLIPESILSKKPTAGLWEGQTDEGEFGFGYSHADEILYQLFDEKKSVEEIIASGFNKELIDKVQAFVAKNSFKHHLPIVPD